MHRHQLDQGLPSSRFWGYCIHKSLRLDGLVDIPHQKQIHLSLLDSVKDDVSHKVLYPFSPSIIFDFLFVHQLVLYQIWKDTSIFTSGRLFKSSATIACTSVQVTNSAVWSFVDWTHPRSSSNSSSWTPMCSSSMLFRILVLWSSIACIQTSIV